MPNVHWKHHNGEILFGDEVKVVKGRKVPIGTIANVKAIYPYHDRYGRWVCDYALSRQWHENKC